MDNVFILNPSADSLDIKDTISDKLTKAQAITSCFISNYCNEATLNQETIINLIWTINDLLEELAYLIKHSDND